MTCTCGESDFPPLFRQGFTRVYYVALREYHRGWSLKVKKEPGMKKSGMPFIKKKCTWCEKLSVNVVGKEAGLNPNHISPACIVKEKERAVG